MRRISLVAAACVWAWGLGLVALSLTSGSGSSTLRADTASSSQPSSATSTPVRVPLVSAAGEEKLSLSAALEQAEKGKFQDAMATLTKAAASSPQDKRLAEARELIEKYLGRFKEWDAERQQEFDRAAARVQWSLLAQRNQSFLTASKIDKPLREKVSEMDQQMSRVALSDWLEQAASDKAEEMKARAAEVSQKMIASLQDATKLLKDDANEYGKTFRELTGKLKQRIDAYAKAWGSIVTATPKDLRAASHTVASAEEELSDALGDVEVLVAENPWRAGLGQARLARTVSPGRDGMNEFAWYRDLVKDVTARGEEAVKAGKWYDALNVYSSLHELDPDNDAFAEKLKVVRRHVRVLSLYGRKQSATTAASADPNAPADDSEPRWQELTENVDADIVHNVIAQLDEQYVAAVDYRKLTRGALLAIQVLGETPEASNAFPGLADADKKKAFLEAVNRELDNLDKNDRVDSVYLSMVLNTVIRQSEKTVGIPLGVIAMEFTDGFLEELDRFSAMIWPVEVDDFNKQTMGQFFGVGIQISKEPNEPLKVVSPLPNSPAFREGVKTGDLILTVDGVRTEPLSVDKLVRRIQGPKGTKVVLTVLSRGQTQPREVQLVRDEIRIHTVKGWRLDPGGDGDSWVYYVDPKDKVAYIRIAQFTSETAGAMTKALQQLTADGCHSVILDLRFNPGGLLDSAKVVVDEFIDGVRRILETRGRQKPKKEYMSNDGGVYTRGDLVVMVNELSASASEIVSGALQDTDRALILGQRSYGKGSVQNVLPIPRHSAYLKLTTAYYYLPSGRLLHRKEGSKEWGVDPQVEVRMTPRQTKHWLSLQRKTDLLQDIDPAELSADLKDEYQADFQLETAVLLLKLMQLQEGAGAPEATPAGVASPRTGT